MHQIRVAGQLYEWTLSITSEFKQLKKWGDSDELEVLRISSLDKSFDMAIRVLVWQDLSGTYRHLGPALVLGHNFPMEQCAAREGILIELRPKVCCLPEDGPDSASVERVVQWCRSKHFRVRRINSSGGRWVGYGYPADA